VRPLVALVSYELGPGRVARWSEGGFGVPSRYVERLRAAGARTAIVAPGEPGPAEALLDPFDALVLVGGGDVEPHRYGAEPGSHLYGLEPLRDELELALLRAADALGVPTFCICRGMQVMNVAFGGTLHQHLPDLPGLLEHGVPAEDTVSTHDVHLEPGGRIARAVGSEILSCSSHHHQGVDALGEGLLASGRSRDGLVEAIERDGSGWMLGVQWHPEDTAGSDRAQQALFDALIERARG
jgi:putative glutamine amidotransferase